MYNVCIMLMSVECITLHVLHVHVHVLYQYIHLGIFAFRISFRRGGGIVNGLPVHARGMPPPLHAGVWPTTPEACPGGGSDDVSRVTVAVGYMYMCK